MITPTYLIPSLYPSSRVDVVYANSGPFLFERGIVVNQKTTLHNSPSKWGYGTKQKIIRLKPREGRVRGKG